MKEEISLSPDEIKTLGSKLVEVILDNFEDPMNVKDLLLAIETLTQLTEMFQIKLEKSGVIISHRSEERIQ